jgi:predicted Fe-Mo cluster-binding NifX family protein
MRIAVAANAPDLEAQVERRLGLCSYLLMVDTQTMACRAVPAPQSRGGPGAGIAAVTLALANQAEAIIAGYVSPNIAGTLRENGVEVVTCVGGSAREAVEKFARGELDRQHPPQARGGKAVGALKTSARQFASVLPILLGVILLVGLLKALVTEEALLSVFTGNPSLDALLGAAFGSVFAGNPVNSYVIADALLSSGVSLFAVTAVLLTWVSVGLVQLPAEMSALGTRFAVSRAAAAFVVSVAAAFLTASLVGALA